MASRILATLSLALMAGPVSPGQASPGRAADVDGDVARRLAAEFSVQYASPKESLRLLAVNDLAGSRHALVAKALAAAFDDSDGAVRLAAVRALALQAPKDAGPRLRAALDQAERRKDAAMQAAVLTALTAVRTFLPLQRLEQILENGPKEARRAAVVMMGAMKEKKAVRILREHLDCPRPANVDSPTNPPASYWKVRMANWEHIADVVQDALHALTGRHFDSRDELDEWLRKEGSRAGF